MTTLHRDMIKFVKLRNGSEEPEVLVRTTFTAICRLYHNGFPDMLPVVDLARICQKDPTYKPYGTNEQVLKEMALLQPDGTPHDSVRNIVLSSVTGEGLNMFLVNPISNE